jgi:phage nucleotide-binding protein
MIPQGEAEMMLADADFIGFIDLIAPATGFHATEVPDVYDLFDYKYTSNSSSRYAESEQLHLYKYWFEKLNPGKKIRKLNYIIVPKVNVKTVRGESLQDYRRRIESELSKKEIRFLPVEYEPEKVIGFLSGVKHVLEATEYPKAPSFLCNYCEYADYCKKGLDYMLLPSTARRDLSAVTKRVIWLYGAPFSGKTWFANQFPNPLMLNTDGNIKFVDAPFIPIKDKVEMNGRLTNRTFAWSIFKEVVTELEKKQNDFKTIIVDLTEDVYEACRLYMYDQLGISHESDDSYRAWDKVRTEFLSNIRKVTNLDYENIILISHEDTSRDLTKKGGDKVTAIKPNIQEKIANKIAGMVDIVARVVADGDDRVLSFKCTENIFSGGRLTIKEREIPLEYDAFVAVYNEANTNAKKTLSGRREKAEAPAPAAITPAASKDEETPPWHEPETPNDAPVNATCDPNTGDPPEPPKNDVPKVRTRRKRAE